MINPTNKKKLATIPPAERVLLLPHCLRPTENCPGKYSKQGLVCPEDCSEPCAIRALREAAMNLGYKGSCVAPGGALALRFVKEMKPRGIVAVACGKELELGIDGVESMAESEDVQTPVIEVIPLSKNGCVDTDVDVEQALRTIELAEEPILSHGGGG